MTGVRAVLCMKFQDRL